MIPLPLAQPRARSAQGPLTVSSMSERDALPTSWLLALMATLVDAPLMVQPRSSAVAASLWRGAARRLALLTCALLHGVVPHWLFWLCARVVVAPLPLSVLFLSLVVGGILVVGYCEHRSVVHRVGRYGWDALSPTESPVDTGDGGGGDGRQHIKQRVVSTSGGWPLRTVSSLLGWIAMTGYCTWRFSVDYYYAYYPFWDLGQHVVLWWWLVPTALISLALFLSLSARPARRAACNKVDVVSTAPAAFFFLPVGAVVTEETWWACRALSLSLLGLLLAELYYAYQLSMLLVSVDANMDELLRRYQQGSTSSAFASQPPTDSPHAHSARTLLVAGLWAPGALRTLLRPSSFVFGRSANPVFWRVASVYTTVGLLAGIACALLGLVYPLWRQRAHARLAAR